MIYFGLIINWYRILRDQDKKYICDLFIPDQSMDIEHRKEFLIKSLDLSKEYRNVIAHGSKTIGLNGLPVLPKEQSIRLAGKLLSREEYNSKLGQNDIYSVFIIILTLTNDTTLLMAFYMDCHVFFHKYKNNTFNNKTIFEVFGIPNNLLQRIEAFLRDRLSI